MNRPKPVIRWAQRLLSRFARWTGLTEFTRFHAALPQRLLDLVLTGALGIGREDTDWTLRAFYFLGSLVFALRTTKNAGSR